MFKRIKSKDISSRIPQVQPNRNFTTMGDQNTKVFSSQKNVPPSPKSQSIIFHRQQQKSNNPIQIEHQTMSQRNIPFSRPVNEEVHVQFKNNCELKNGNNLNFVNNYSMEIERAENSQNHQLNQVNEIQEKVAENSVEPPRGLMNQTHKDEKNNEKLLDLLSPQILTQFQSLQTQVYELMDQKVSQRKKLEQLQSFKSHFQIFDEPMIIRPIEKRRKKQSIKLTVIETKIPVQKQLLKPKLPQFRQQSIFFLPSPKYNDATTKNRVGKVSETAINKSVSEFGNVGIVNFEIELRWIEEKHQRFGLLDWNQSPSRLKMTGAIQVMDSFQYFEIQDALFHYLNKTWVKELQKYHVEEIEKDLSLYIVSIEQKMSRTLFDRVMNKPARTVMNKKKGLAEYNLKGYLYQQKINLRALKCQGYYVENPKSFKGFSVSNLCIANEKGKVTWPGVTNSIHLINFSQGFNIGEHEVECEIPALKKEAIVQFFQLPPFLEGKEVSMDEKTELLRKVSNKCRNADFVDWERSTGKWRVRVDFSR